MTNMRHSGAFNGGWCPPYSQEPWSERQMNDAMLTMQLVEAKRKALQNSNVNDRNLGDLQSVAKANERNELASALVGLGGGPPVEWVREQARAASARERESRDARARELELQNQVIQYDIRPNESYLTSDGMIHGASSDGALPAYQIPNRGLFSDRDLNSRYTTLKLI